MTHPRAWRRAGLAAMAIAGAGLAGCSVPPASVVTTPTISGVPAGSASIDDASARQYCTDQGGKLVDRQAYWNTNADPAAWLQLAGRMTLCEFESGQGNETTRISVDLVTLSSTKPTLAAIAYLAKVPPTLPDTPSVNPAEYNCSEGLHGSSTFGNGLAGGGWVNVTEPIFKVMNLCVFPDFSAIDAFGILYYSQGTVRGADLASKLRYQPGDRLPAVFGR